MLTVVLKRCLGEHMFFFFLKNETMLEDLTEIIYLGQIRVRTCCESKCADSIQPSKFACLTNPSPKSATFSLMKVKPCQLKINFVKTFINIFINQYSCVAMS